MTAAQPFRQMALQEMGVVVRRRCVFGAGGLTLACFFEDGAGGNGRYTPLPQILINRPDKVV